MTDIIMAEQPRFVRGCFIVEKLVEKFENSLEIKDKSCTFTIRKIMRTFLMY